MLGTASHILGSSSGFSTTRVMLIATKAEASPSVVPPDDSTTKVYFSDDCELWGTTQSFVSVVGVGTQGKIMSANNIFYSFPNTSFTRNSYYTSQDAVNWSSHNFGSEIGYPTYAAYGRVWTNPPDPVANFNVRFTGLTSTTGQYLTPAGYLSGFTTNRASIWNLASLNKTSTDDSATWTTGTTDPVLNNVIYPDYKAFWDLPVGEQGTWNGTYWAGVSRQAYMFANNRYVRVTGSDGVGVYIEYSIDNTNWTRADITLPADALIYQCVPMWDGPF